MKFLLTGLLRWTIEDDVGDNEKCEQEFSQMITTPFTAVAKGKAKEILRKMYEEYSNRREFSMNHIELYPLKNPIMIIVINQKLNILFS